jgi:hypothetical protein
MVRVFAVKSLLPVAECDDDLKSKVVKTNRTTVSAPPSIVAKNWACYR